MSKIDNIFELQDKGLTRQEIAKQLGYKRLDSMTRYLKKHNYILENDMYVAAPDTSVVDIKKDIIIPKDEVEKATTRTTTESTTLEIVDTNTQATTGTTTNTLDKNIRDVLKDDIDVLKEMIDKYKQNMKVHNSSITVDLIDDRHKKQYPKSIRVNEFIWEDWTKFSEEHNKFSKKELVSMALKEYMEKHSE